MNGHAVISAGFGGGPVVGAAAPVVGRQPVVSGGGLRRWPSGPRSHAGFEKKRFEKKVFSPQKMTENDQVSPRSTYLRIYYLWF